MNCDETRRHWNLYHDSEGDPALHLAINEHLAACSDCAEWYFKQSLFEDQLVQHLAPPAVDAPLWQSVLAAAGVTKVAPRTTVGSRITLLASLAAALLMAVSLGIIWRTLQSQDQPSLSAHAAGLHTRLVGGDVKVPFHSDSDLAVEDFLRRQVSFPVRCPPRRDAGFAVAGAGTCKLAGERVAYLVGKVDDAPVSVFVLSRDSLAAFPHQAAALQTEAVHRCREGSYDMAVSAIDQNVVLVIGRTKQEALEKVLIAYGSYHEPRG